MADLAPLVNETGAHAFACDATKRAEVEKLFAELDAAIGAPEIVIYNASFRTRGPFVDLDPADVEKSLAVTAFGAFLWRGSGRRNAAETARRNPVTGASASVKGYASRPLRHGQVRAARACAKHGARASPARHPCRP